MSLSKATAELAAHMAKMPRPFRPATPEAQAWQATFQKLLDAKDKAARQLIEVVPNADIRPVVMPTRWEDPSQREVKPDKPCVDCGGVRLARGHRCGECQDRHTDAQNKARSLAKAERMRLIREGLAQRKSEAA